MASDDEDEQLAQFLESEVLAEDDKQDDEEKLEVFGSEEAGKANGKRSRVDDGELSDLDEEGQQQQQQQQEAKKIRTDDDWPRAVKSISTSSPMPVLEAEIEVEKSEVVACNNNDKGKHIVGGRPMPRRIETGAFSQIPPELLFHILKFLSSEDLTSCSAVCRFLSFAASDESLWRRLYCMRWGLVSPKKPRECAWKKLYIQRDEEDMAEFVRNCPREFKEYYIQMQVAKRSQAPIPSQVNDDSIILDKTLADQVSIWKSSRGLSDTMVINHACSGESCTYYQIGDVFVCENTGNVHVCDDTCKEVIMDPANELLVCTISGRCFDRLLSPSEEADAIQEQQGGATDEPEPFMGSGRFARAYLLGYNCEDEKELEAALRFC